MIALCRHASRATNPVYGYVAFALLIVMRLVRSASRTEVQNSAVCEASRKTTPYATIPKTTLGLA